MFDKLKIALGYISSSLKATVNEKNRLKKIILNSVKMTRYYNWNVEMCNYIQK